MMKSSSHTNIEARYPKSVAVPMALSMSTSMSVWVMSSVPCCIASTLCMMSEGMSAGIASALTPHMSTPQMSTCTAATAATPRILPIIMSKGLTDETITSSTREFFSSMTLCMTIPP